jgi:N-acetylmuramoyl-L-alanine amidase
VSVCLARAADRPSVRVTAEGSGADFRVILTSSRPLDAELSTTRSTLEIVFPEPVDLSPPRRIEGDPVLAGWRAEGDRTLVLSLGPGYRDHETFTLKNPARLVVDLRGDRKAAGEARAGRQAARPGPSFVVVLDPGHGGVETGAVGPTGLEEKDVALDLARRLKAALQQDPGVAVVLTRDDDRLVPLDERTGIANHNRADLFLSIHLNSARGRRAVGAETFFLSMDATDDAARTTAALENDAYSLPDATVKDRALDPDLELVLWDLAQTDSLARSSRLAEAVQASLNELAGTKNRGVRQAPFRVLQGATMPAILVEVGFVSNPDEEALLKTDTHRARIVEALSGAIRGFRQGLAPPGQGGDTR